MPDLLAIVAIVAGAASWLMCKAWRSLSRHSSDLDWLPRELHDAKLVWSEKAFRCHEPVRIAVRIDRAYRLRDGSLVLIEFKRRAHLRVRLADVAELSAQRYVLNQAGHVVSQRAYVAVILPDGTRSRAMPVEVEDAQQVERRVARLLALRERLAPPSGPLHPAACASCGHRGACPLARRDGPVQVTLPGAMPRRRFPAPDSDGIIDHL